MKLLTQTRLRKRLKRLSAPQTGWTGVFIAMLGKADGTVLTNIPGVVWVHHLLTGQDLMVYNNIVPITPKLQVEVGQRVDQPGLWQIKGTAEVYDVPSTRGPVVVPHHEQHQFPNLDTVWVDRKQISPLTVLVTDAANFIVKLYGAAVLTVNGITKIATQSVDLSSYVPTAGAKFVSIESDNDGAITVNEGAVFGSPHIGTVDNIPSPAAGKYTRAYVLLYEGQTALSNDDIVVPMPPDFNPVAFSGSGHAHFNDTEGDPADVSISASADGTSTYAARRDHVHLFTPTGFVEEAPEDGHIYGRKDAAWEVVPIAEILMEDGPTFPPVPLTTEDGTDWIYDA